MAIQLRKQLTGAWEQVRYGLRLDLDTIEAALNTRLAQIAATIDVITTTITGVLDVPHGGTGFSAFTKGDLLVGNAATTLDKLGVGTNGQVLTADSTKLDGVAWEDPAGSGTLPLVVLVNTTIPTNSNAVVSDSLEIAGGVLLEIVGGARLEITGDASADAGSLSLGMEAPFPGTQNLSTIGDLDFFNAGTTAFVPQASSSYHSKLTGGQIAVGFAWMNPTGSTLTTLAGGPTTMLTTAGDDINTILNTAVVQVVTTGTALGWRFRIPAGAVRRYLRLYVSLTSGTATLTVSLPQSACPAQSFVYQAGTGVARWDRFKISFTGQGDLIVVLKMTTNPAGTASLGFGYATLSSVG